MAKPKGSKKIGGRTKGTPNKLTTSVKEAVQLAFDSLQLDSKANLKTWGKENPTEFYKLAAKLIPTDLKADLTSKGNELKQWTINIVDEHK
jgi:hypothetical protein